MDWIEKITGVIVSLLCSQIPERKLPCNPMSSGYQRTASASSSSRAANGLESKTEDNSWENKECTGECVIYLNCGGCSNAGSGISHFWH